MYKTVGRSILVFDDNLQSSQHLANILQTNTDWRIRFAGSVPQALTHVAAYLPDGILVSWNIPRMSRSTFLHHLRSSLFGKNIPVVVLVHQEHMTRQEREKRGVIVINKPLYPEALPDQLAYAFGWQLPLLKMG